VTEKDISASPSSRRVKPYPSYKDFGVEWLGKIPAHWRPRRLKFLSRINMGQSPPSEIVNTLGDGLPFLQGNADFGTEHPFVRTFCLSAPKTAEPGDILLSVRAPVGALNIADIKYGIGRGLCAIRPSIRDLERKYCYYVLQIARLQLDAIAKGSTYDAVSTDDVSCLSIPLPPVDEQRIVALFLDRETAKIDALIAKKERLIELLQEKRTALITQAVTKGLDPNVPMKDSGIEWLGKTPAHWRILPFKRLFEVIYRYPTYYGIEYVLDGVREIRGEAIAPDGQMLELKDQRYISLELSAQFGQTILQEGDLVMSVRGTMGKVGFVDKNWAGSNITANLMRLSPRPELIEGRFLIRALSSQYFLQMLDLQAPQTTIKTITVPQLAVIPIPVPPLLEQEQILALLENEISKIDALAEGVHKGWAQLKEYRSALISAAVTGKIDVQGES